MKKLLLYTLIIIASFSLIGVSQVTHAQTPLPNTPPLGWCVFVAVGSSTGNTTTVNEIGKDRCEKPVAEGGRAGKWYPTDPKIKTGSAIQPVNNFSTTEYKFLSPLPCQQGSPGCVQNAAGKWEMQIINLQGDNVLGKYLNLMLKIFIGLCAVMAVVMIVMGGLEYMTSELISSKEEGKSKITGALFGLVIALGAYALLNTINPDLLKSDFDIPDTQIAFMEEEEVLADVQNTTSTPPPTTGAITGCSVGVVSVAGGMYACKSIAQNINNMIADAAKANLTIKGSGYRTPDRQTQLRKQNCKGNTTDRTAPCTPPTALPGYSRHNSGLAFDLRCGSEGVIQSLGNACFKWLKDNAKNYGLYNYPPEPWHWSTDGR